MILEIIRQAILEYRNEPLWDVSVKLEEKHRKTIKIVADNWEKAVKGASKKTKPKKRKRGK